MGIPCNRADHAARGDFIVPGVVRRGAVTFTASTSGRAPALTRHFKRKLAASFGEEWGSLAALLAEMRGTGAAELARGTVPDNLPFDSLAETLRSGAVDAARNLLRRTSGVDPAQAAAVPHPVLLAGGGPGDRDMLTVSVAQALQNAEVLIHDRLVDPGILELAPDTCLRIPAEKRGHFQSQRQEHINALLLQWARAGKRVLRLKGGDPFVFGRGFEEAQALEAAGIPWRVLPGISSAIAVPALAGIPLTHRGVARSFAVASGMADGGINASFPKADTLVLLMALYRLDEIVPALIRSGYAPETPAAAIESGGLPEQRVCRSTLGKLGEKTARQGFDSPTLIVVGEVVGLTSPPPPD
jgi:uroporphyrin-III C-methyltransferase/precorrin-2 dehydrogenase/sirohydrochlorin ferrochelatase